MNIENFRAELETRLLIEKEYIVQEFSSITDDQEQLELLGKFNGKYKDLIKRIANEGGIDISTFYTNGNSSDRFTYEQIILGKTMSIYDRLADELYEKITNRP